VVQLDRSRGAFIVKRAATLNLPPELIRANFDESNVEPARLAEALSDLAMSAGLLRQKKWSVSLPEVTARSAILTLENAGGSRREVDEVIEWKIERTFGAPAAELRVARQQLPANEQKQERYLATAIRLSVLAEYEAAFAMLGWHAGVVLPRHVGEEQWLREGFTAVLLRNGRPVTLRSVFCDPGECDDELHRVLLFYRERAGSNGDGVPVDRLLVIGEGLDKNRVAEIARDSLGVNLRPLDAADVGLSIPGDLPFDTIAAPAGLARLAW